MLFLNIIYRTDAILPYLENAKSDLRPKHKELCVLHKRQNAVEIKKSLMISANLATSKSNTSARNNNSSSNITPTTSFSSNITTNIMEVDSPEATKTIKDHHHQIQQHHKQLRLSI